MNGFEYSQAREFIYTDIQREINLAKISENFIGKFLLKTLIKYPGGANFMTAMALLCYTEAAGKIITGNDNEARADFLVFFEKLGPEYLSFKVSHNVMIFSVVDSLMNIMSKRIAQFTCLAGKQHVALA